LSRILPVGDSSGNQSPLSFGGFGAMVRHLKRLTAGIHEALSTDQLSLQAGTPTTLSAEPERYLAVNGR